MPTAHSLPQKNLSSQLWISEICKCVYNACGSLSPRFRLNVCTTPQPGNLTCPTRNVDAYSADSVADATTVGIIALMKQMEAIGAALSAQSPREKIPPALERASDSLR